MLLADARGLRGAFVVLCFTVGGVLGLLVLGDYPSPEEVVGEPVLTASDRPRPGLETSEPSEPSEPSESPEATQLEAAAGEADEGRLPEEPDRLASLEQDVKPTCEMIGSKLGSVSVKECLARQLGSSGGRSVQGTPILVKEYAPLEGRRPLGRVLLIGGIHGDEYSSVSIVFKWLEMLDEHHSGLFHWRVVPLLNPDGLLRAQSQRMNDRGVDLNRNFPTPNWKEDATDYWVRRTSSNPRRYPGPEPLSEPESRWLHDEILSFRPTTIVTVHAPLEVVDYDGPPEPPTKLGPLYLHQMGTYPGSLGRFGGEYKGLPVVTIELPSAGIMPTVEKQRTIWRDLVSYLGQNIPRQQGIRPSAVATGGSS